MAEVHFETDAKISISDAAVRYAERHYSESENEEEESS